MKFNQISKNIKLLNTNINFYNSEINITNKYKKNMKIIIQNIPVNIDRMCQVFNSLVYNFRNFNTLTKKWKQNDEVIDKYLTIKQQDIIDLNECKVTKKYTDDTYQSQSVFKTLWCSKNQKWFHLHFLSFTRF